MRALLTQAKSLNAGLEKTPEYKALANEINYAIRSIQETPNMDPSPATRNKIDNAIYRLYHKMAGYIQ